MSIGIRPLKPSDAKQVALLIPQLTPNIADPQNLVGRLEKLSLSPIQSRYLVAETGSGKIIGFGGLVWYEIPSKGLMGFVEEVVVDEKYRGARISDYIVLELLSVAESEGLKQVKLTSANPAALHIYEELGFVVKEETLMIKKYY